MRQKIKIVGSSFWRDKPDVVWEKQELVHTQTRTIHPTHICYIIICLLLADACHTNEMSRSISRTKAPPDTLSAAYLEGASGKKVSWSLWRERRHNMMCLRLRAREQ